MLCFFLVKGIFKRQSDDDSMRIEVTRGQHPELFRFIWHLCRETRAPFPHRIFLSPEVNAAVFYHSSLLNLIFPVKKNLLIGLGLVNCLTLSEFKAVLAHEFGHFSQSSMRLGSYVYMANRIVADMVYNRDTFDDWLARWRRMEIRFALFGHLVYGVVWVLRKTLALAYRGINFVESALSRQMEFHADLVAVSVTGSDSLKHALRRLGFAHESLQVAIGELKDAADHQLYTRDLFYHQLRAGEYLRTLNEMADPGQPPPLPDEPGARTQVFDPADEGIPSMWSSHPSHYDREQNAKKVYIRSPEDSRSPWLLFNEPTAVRELMTRRFYEYGLQLPAGTVFADPEAVQLFIDEERAEKKQDPRYHGLYDGRAVEPGDLAALAGALHQHPWSHERLSKLFNRLYNGEFKEWLEEHELRRGELQLLNALEDGSIAPKGKVFPFRNGEYRMDDVKRLLSMVEGELETDHKYLQELDAQVFQAHYQMAAMFRDGSEREVFSRYQFQIAIQGILREMNVQSMIMARVIGFLQSQTGSLGESEMQQVSAALVEARRAVAKVMADAATLPMPPLRNLTPGEPLSQFLLNGPVVAEMDSALNSLSVDWLAELMRQIAEIKGKCRRLHFKNLGAILALQENVAGRWRAALTGPQPGLREAVGRDPTAALSAGQA